MLNLKTTSSKRAIVLIFAVAMLSACQARTQTTRIDTLPPAEFIQGEEFVVVGFVDENQIDCHNERPCVLKLVVDDQLVVVLYEQGMGKPPCGNEASFEGLFIEQGAEVVVFGKALSDNWLSTCDSTDYYAKVLRTHDEVIGVGEERLVSGVVIENNQGCEIDIACVLRLDTGAEEISVAYHYGMLPPCKNEQAMDAGFQLERGDLVEVFGRIEEDGSFSTCESESYYIRTLP